MTGLYALRCPRPHAYYNEFNNMFFFNNYLKLLKLPIPYILKMYWKSLNKFITGIEYCNYAL